MKRVPTLFALATLAFAGMTLPHAASAATVCGVVQQNPNSWPYNQENDCTSSDGSPSTSDANSDSEAIIGQTHGLAGEQLNQLQISSYIFEDPADFKSVTAFASQPTPDANAFGTVVLDANNMPTAIISFEKNGNGVATPSASYSAGRAVGHAIDYTLGYVMNGGVITLPATPMSSSSIFSSELTYDWSVLNAMSPCTAGGQGVFNNKTDHNGAYICTTSGSGATLSAGYSGNVQNVMKTAWPGVYDTNANIFAEIYGNLYIGSDARDSYLNQYFTCTNSVEILASNGGKISNSTTSPPLPSACPVPPISTSCNQIFAGEASGGYPSYGYMFDCNPNNGSANEVAQAFQTFGSGTAQSQSNNTLKMGLKTDKSYIYFFTGDSQYQSVFQAAGLSTSGTSLANANSATAPIKGVWYSVINEYSGDNTTPGSSNPQPISSQISYQLAHELGHTIDLNMTPPGSTVKQISQSDAFKLAYQLDVYNMTYASWNNTTKTGVLRNYCATGGVLVNIQDPITSNAFCTGTTLETYLAGKPIMSILQQTATYADSAPENFTREISYQSAVTPIGNTPAITEQAGWREWFAQAIAIASKANLGATSNKPILDGVVANGGFACTLGTPAAPGWLTQVYLGQTVVISTACKATLPSNYPLYNVDNE